MGELPIINCPKCSSFWAVFLYGMLGLAEIGEFVTVLAISFFASYSALWLELLEGTIDTLYMKLYGKIITTAAHDTPSSDSDDGDSEGTLSQLQQEYKNNH